ncbi:MAG: S8 family serine peptidase [Saprospiraceae bacterium]|nr:S8 family serine peptidase [Saprospiraceae bacterium]MDW8485019.1 S8 family serine peptidase [Saprospiraceae bacterium]
MRNKRRLLLVITFCLPAFFSLGQSKAPDNWFTLDKATDKVQGTSSDKALAILKAKGRKGKPIIVAVLDSGVDVMHEDLKDIIWVNPGEIPGNGIDDDNNGYVDDIHGWNFLGGPDGQNIHHETLELTREYVRLSKKFEGVDPKKLYGEAKKEYEYYLKIKQDFEEARREAEASKAQIAAQFERIEKAFATIANALGKTVFTEEDLKTLDTKSDKELEKAVELAKRFISNGITPENLEKIKEETTGNQLRYNLNPDYNPRHIVGDNPNDLTNRFYGNNDYRGPDAAHGTHVAGIIAAVRDNGIGINGIADNVRIMTVRCVPDGDERDKDVANAIRYAVDNGASIINMSFGKGYSPDKKYVDDAAKYAAEHDVLLVHAAGNDASNNDVRPNFPNPNYIEPVRRGLFRKERVAPNWLEVGALSWAGGERCVANFSNYGKRNVHLFAPGHQIKSTIPDNQYATFSGTSMASPSAAGVAAIIRSYFPELSAAQVRDILVKSVSVHQGEVYKPGSTEKVKLSDLCISGGVVNAVNAIALAEKTKPAKRNKKAIWREAGEGKPVKLRTP